MTREIFRRANFLLACIVAFFLWISYHLKLVFTFPALRSTHNISDFDFIIFQINMLGVFILSKFYFKVSFRRLLVCKRRGARFLNYFWNLRNKQIIQFQTNFINFICFILLKWGSYLVIWWVVLIYVIIFRTCYLLFEWISFILFTFIDSTLHGIESVEYFKNIFVLGKVVFIQNIWNVFLVLKLSFVLTFVHFTYALCVLLNLL